VYGRGLFVLDDPLSAVDSHVAEHIFRKCIVGVMSKKTCVLVTHRLNLLKNVPHIVVLDEHQVQEDLLYWYKSTNADAMFLNVPRIVVLDERQVQHYLLYWYKCTNADAFFFTCIKKKTCLASWCSTGVRS
jgi:energy-coupling factor transporter ATP-binding protein EcfA2